jgi:hypothetical protein
MSDAAATMPPESAAEPGDDDALDEVIEAYEPA